MTTRTPKKSYKKQAKISSYAQKLRSKHNSAPGSFLMAAIQEEEDEFVSLEEPLGEDVSLKEVIEKLNEIGKRVESIENTIFGDESGLSKRIAEQELKAETAQGKMLFMTKEYKGVKHDLSIVKGVIQRHAMQIQTADNKITDITARSMAMNMMITGIVESKTENCRFQVKDFLKQEMDIDLDMCPEFKIKAAHRSGVERPVNKATKKKVPRVMIAKVNQLLKEEILNNLERLNDRMNIQGDPFYVNVQQPEARLESRRNAKALLRKFQAKFATAKVEIRGEKVYVNNEWQRPPVHAPQPKDLFCDPEEQKEMNKLRFFFTKPEENRSSTFWSAATRVSSTAEVQRAYNKLRQDSPSIDHIAVAYVVKQNENDEIISGLVDDKEHGAGHKILRVINEKKQQGVAVFVARRFGGEHIGPSRFRVVSDMAVKAIEQLNHLDPIPARSPPSGAQQAQKSP